MLRRKRRAFMSLSRKKRGLLVFGLKNRIRRETVYNGGRFASHQIVDEPGAPENYSQWADFHFLGRDKFICWNASMRTAKSAFWDAVEDVARDRAYAALGDEIRKPAMEWKPADVAPTGKILTWEWVRHEPVRHEQFDGRSLDEEITRLEAEIVREEPPAIFEEFVFDDTYAFGIGLRIVADVDVVSRATIETTIDRFMELGETEWRAPVPVRRDRLPTISMEEARQKGEYTSGMFGAAIRMPLKS